MDDLALKVVGLIVLAVLLVIFGPLGTIWAINTLFLTTIPFTLKTWFAALFLTAKLTSKFPTRT